MFSLLVTTWLHHQVLSQRKMSRPQTVPSASPADGEAILRPRTRPRASVAGAGLVPSRCPLLGPRADLSDAASSCGGSDEAASSCTSSAADTVSMVEDAVDDSRLSEVSNPLRSKASHPQLCLQLYEPRPAV